MSASKNRRRSRRERKQRWFDAGTEALQRVTGQPSTYVCPLCLREIASIDELTFEHAPPRRLGGRDIALTCRACNSGAGAGVDAELGKAHDYRRFWRGELDRPVRARLTFEGIPANVSVSRLPDLSLTVVGVPEINDPAASAAQDAAFERIAASGEPYREPLHFQFAGFNERQARIGLLRSAYVVAFAVFGYRYAARQELEIVREQIANPAERLLGERFSLHRGKPMRHRAVAWLERPRSLESVIVQIDDHLVFLPGLKRGPTIYERLDERKAWPPRRRTFSEMVATSFPWPTSPMHIFDS